ncbi:MAG: DUF4347 domain-containing protein, partial [Psychrobium sp.]
MNTVFNGVVAAMMPLGLCLAAPTPSGSYSYVGQRKQDYLIQNLHAFPVYNLPSSSSSGSSPQLSIINSLSSADLWQKSDNSPGTILEISSLESLAAVSKQSVEIDELYIMQQMPIKELIVIDEAVSDKHLFYQQLKPGVDIVEITSENNGLTQLKKLLSGYQNLQALHLVSHGEDGVIQLGNSQVTEQLLKHEMATLSALDNALDDGADLHIYGCNVAKTAKGEQLLELIANQAHVDVAASNNTTGSGQLASDWSLEIVKGDVDSKQYFDSNSMRNFSSILAQTQYTGDSIFTAAGASYYQQTSLNSSDNKFVISNSVGGLISSFSNGNGRLLGYGSDYYGQGIAVTADGTNSGSFELHKLKICNDWSGGGPGVPLTTDLIVTGTYSSGGNASTNITVTTKACLYGANEFDEQVVDVSSTFGTGKSLSGFKVEYNGAAPVDKYFSLVSFTVDNVQTPVSNNSPTDISLTAIAINDSATGVNATVGTLSSTDADGSDTHTYSLVTDGSSANGDCGAITSDDNNTSFNINGSALRTTSSLAAGNYNVCLQTNDGTTTFQKGFAITVKKLAVITRQPTARIFC